MENQKPQPTSAPSTPVKPANPTTPTPSAPPAAGTTTSNVSPSNPQPAQFKGEECIVLVVSPSGTIHPVVHKTGKPPGARVFETTEEAISEVMNAPIGKSNPFAVVPLKGMF